MSSDVVASGVVPAEAETEAEVGAARSTDLALARAHLRLGSLALARAELETLADLGRLDTDGMLDLAEVRWRTGDLVGAGDAAIIVLATDERRPIALLIAAEAAAVDGRPGEARRLASRAIECADGPIDALFAGMPRAGVWPTDAAEPAPIAGTLFHREAGDALARTAFDEESAAAATGLAGAPAAVVAAPYGPEVGSAAAAALTLWDGDGEADLETASLPEPAEELQAARAALESGALDEAALRFSLALRAAPALAPAVLEATERTRSAALSLVRGDAYRSLGHETEARQAYAVAARGGLPDRRQHLRTSSVAEPADRAAAAAASHVDEVVDPGPPGAADLAPADEAADPAPAADAASAADPSEPAEANPQDAPPT